MRSGISRPRCNPPHRFLFFRMVSRLSSPVFPHSRADFVLSIDRQITGGAGRRGDDGRLAAGSWAVDGGAGALERRARREAAPNDPEEHLPVLGQVLRQQIGLASRSPAMVMIESGENLPQGSVCLFARACVRSRSMVTDGASSLADSLSPTSFFSLPPLSRREQPGAVLASSDGGGAKS